MKTTIASAARALTILAAATLGCNAAGASAQNVSSGPSVAGAPLTYVVRYTDLDLSSIDGATALYARIRHAANIVCQPFDSWDGMNDLYRTCMKSAIANAVASVDRPLVSQVHLSRTNRLVRLSAAN